MLEYLRRQIDEIASDRALRLYGCFLSSGHVLGVFWWIGSGHHRDLGRGGRPLCWPFFETCFEYRFLDAAQVFWVFVAFGLAAAIGALLFLIPRLITTAYLWQIGLNLLKALILFQDFRLRMNQHYMLFFVTVVFLFLPGKRTLLRYTLVMFYVWAATLKFNAEWISGAALYRKPLFVPESLIPAACVYVVVLEAIIVWGVLSDRRIVYWIALAQLCLFHIVSWPVVGFFYPLLMLGLLSIFPLTYFTGVERRLEPRNLLGALLRGRERGSAYAFIACFSALQCVPHLMPGDASLTGEGRLFALHMFDARVRCEGSITLRFEDGTSRSLNLPLREAFRIKCDPLVNLSFAKSQCRVHAGGGLVRLDLTYSAARAHEGRMRRLVHIEDLCSQDLSYDMWRSNPWIIKSADESYPESRS